MGVDAGAFARRVGFEVAEIDPELEPFLFRGFRVVCFGEFHRLRASSFNSSLFDTVEKRARHALAQNHIDVCPASQARETEQFEETKPLVRCLAGRITMQRQSPHTT